jgi:cysteine desulfurase / selenocysteine lyase
VAAPTRISPQELRAEFPITAERAYLIVGGIAPAARPVRAVSDAWLERWSRAPLDNFLGWPDDVDVLRATIADLIGAKPAEIAITDGTSRAANIAVDLLARRHGTTVLVDPTTYPSSLYPWLTKTSKQLVACSDELSVDDWPLSPDTTLAATCVSHVAWRTGHRHDLEALSRRTHARGGLLFVDVAQSAGCVPIDVGRDGVDVLVGTTMKWLLGPPGVGFLYVREDLLADAPPRDVGYVGIAVDQEVWPPRMRVDPVAGARRFELGVPNLMGIVAARAGIELVASVGVATLAAHAERLVSHGIERARSLGLDVRTPPDAAHRAGVLAVGVHGAEALAAHLAGRGVDVMGFASGLVRIDGAGFNTLAEIDRAFDEIGEWLDAGSRMRRAGPADR